MANTTNFGWETPDDTDLVKDGALAMRTLGNAIDTSLVDLKGGTTGQVLSKNTNTDMDFTWVTPNDADAIQNSIVDAKGDLISATADNTPARLASSGVNGQVLTVDTSTSTGLKWAAPAAAGFKGVSVYDTAESQSIPNNTVTTLTWNLEYYDTDGFHSTTTNTSRFTVPAGLGGYYLVTFAQSWEVNGTGVRAYQIKKNGDIFRFGTDYVPSATVYVGGRITIVVPLAVGDYIEARVFQTSGGNLGVYKSGSPGTQIFEMYYLGA